MARKKKLTPSLEKAVAAVRQARLDRERNGIYRGVFMRLTLNDAAYDITKGMDNAEFREFVSAAILNMAKGRGR